MSWIPGGRQGPELRDCILWERAVRDVDPGKMKSLLAAGVRPQVDDAALIQVVKASASFERAEQAQAAIAAGFRFFQVNSELNFFEMGARQLLEPLGRAAGATPRSLY